MITQERLKQVLRYDPETGTFTRIRKGVNPKVGSINSWGYLLIRVDGRSYLAHRLAWLYVNGKFPSGQIDHVDRNKLNNRIDNLRDVNDSDNKQNREGKGWVRLDKNLARPYMAQIRTNGRDRHLGYFATPEEAHRAYLDAKAAEHPMFSGPT